MVIIRFTLFLSHTFVDLELIFNVDIYIVKCVGYLSNSPFLRIFVSQLLLSLHHILFSSSFFLFWPQSMHMGGNAHVDQRVCNGK